MTTRDTNQPLQQITSTQPRARLTLRTVSLALVVIGILVSGYLTYVKLTETTLICVGGAFDCSVVQGSVYSKLFGIPIAYLGLATYLVLGALLLLEDRIDILREYGITLVFGITLFAFLYSMWLVYVQAVLLQALCPWCLIHEMAMTLLFIVSGLRLKRMLSQ